MAQWSQGLPPGSTLQVFSFKVVYQLSDDRFLDAKLFLTGMRERSVDAREPG